MKFLVCNPTGNLDDPSRHQHCVDDPSRHQHCRWKATLQFPSLKLPCFRRNMVPLELSCANKWPTHDLVGGRAVGTGGSVRQDRHGSGRAKGRQGLKPVSQGASQGAVTTPSSLVLRQAYLLIVSRLFATY
eukprot:scaffold107894_cov32-Prasinocladus_malaysianus.AAC.1